MEIRTGYDFKAENPPSLGFTQRNVYERNSLEASPWIPSRSIQSGSDALEWGTRSHRSDSTHSSAESDHMCVCSTTSEGLSPFRISYARMSVLLFISIIKWWHTTVSSRSENYGVPQVSLCVLEVNDRVSRVVGYFVAPVVLWQKQPTAAHSESWWVLVFTFTRMNLEWIWLTPCVAATTIKCKKTPDTQHPLFSFLIRQTWLGSRMRLSFLKLSNSQRKYLRTPWPHHLSHTWQPQAKGASWLHSHD